MSRERRVEPRLVVPMRVRYKSHNPDTRRSETVDTTSQNIGLGGLMLIAHQSLPKGAILELEIYLQATDREPVKAEGTVSWQSARSGGPDRFDTGVKFRFMDIADKRRFLDFVFKNQEHLVGLKREKF